MKKQFLAAAMACLLLCGCDRTEAPPEPVRPPAEEVPSGGILTETGQAVTLQDYFGRTAIIGRNQQLEGSFIQTEVWALEYGAQKYPNCAVEARYVSGYVFPKVMSRDGLSGGVAVWELAITRTDGVALEPVQVQIFYFQEDQDGSSRLWFSGLLAGEQMLKTRPESYAWLALDTRFASRLQTIPGVEGPEGAKTVQFDRWCGDALDQLFYPLNERMTAVLCHYSNSEEQGDRLLLWDLETDELLLDEQLEGYWDAAALREGVLTLEQYLDMGEGSRVCTLRLTETGPKLDRESLQDGQFRVGDYLLLWQDASILLDGEVLLQGSQPEEEEEEIGGAVYYNFHQALDAHRFLYSRAGWEWIEYYGIYDLETRTTHPILGGESRFGYTVLQVSADGKRALACYADEAGYWSPALVDLETFGQRSLSLGFDTVEEAVSGQLRASGSLNRLAVCDLGEDGVYRIRVFDTGSGAELFAWDVPENRVAGEPEIRLAGEDTLLVNLRQWKTDTEWVYRITF